MHEETVSNAHLIAVGNFESLTKQPRKDGHTVKNVMLMDNTASYCLAEERKSRPVPHYNDVDISLFVNLRNERDHYAGRKKNLKHC